ncbi:MAG: 16S rRNA (guanine(527)-N(7))-methyltransferase RsmG [Tabrizicola sp.]|uniref:16S rRNA (guanine(527)-N(7))-methyltransferase RsmG n=1 Tax=Tabrizicola sp. TaxID=2005166 RepID=UPI002ABAEBB3|nr:16S rRNA (guanine(527)-N(7))-methyltransferase RsmG [Tabrizicola sp.]MDZ4089008.1 16S rRNA (guanine(527)-N(7))-methyltransferase RsmG [Tabrizicola sp.]
MTAATELSVGGVNVSRETFEALRAFEALVRRWNPAINLVSKNSMPDLWDRHIADSAQVFAVCPSTAVSWADFGSGGGFPGLVVALLAKQLQPKLHVTLVESDLRKATFLRQAAVALALHVTVRSERIESLAPLSADVLSARALAPLSDLLAFAKAHLRPDGIAIFPKGARYQDEILHARKAWDFDVDTRPSLSEGDAALLVIRNIHHHV